MKKLSADNWLQPDGPVAGGSEAWRDAFLGIHLDRRVPADIAAMFDAARGAMIYGRFFAPLVSLGVEHCYRLLEAAARARCLQLGLEVDFADKQGRRHELSFDHNLRQLQAHGALDVAALGRWQQARELRNWAADPAHQAVLTPSHGVTALTRTAELLAGLFAPI
jgi:hypothetical protein